jgi:8-amino-7-oxononanoate synthase
VVRAAERALAVNRHEGDALRLRLARLVHRLWAGLRQAGIDVAGGLFPVQTLGAIRGESAVALHGHLLRRGVRAVLHRARGSSQTRLSFLISAGHSPEQIDEAVDAVVRVTTTLDMRRFPCSTHLRAAAGA